MEAEEGMACPDCYEGDLEYIRDDSCSCHINPPCGACVDAVLGCPECGWEQEEE